MLPEYKQIVLPEEIIVTIKDQKRNESTEIITDTIYFRAPSMVEIEAFYNLKSIFNKAGIEFSGLVTVSHTASNSSDSAEDNDEEEMAKSLAAVLTTMNKTIEFIDGIRKLIKDSWLKSPNRKSDLAYVVDEHGERHFIQSTIVDSVINSSLDNIDMFAGYYCANFIQR